MAIATFIGGADRRQLWIMGSLTVLAGMANAALVVMINDVTALVAGGDRPSLWIWVGFAIAFLIYYQCNTFGLLHSNALIEHLLNRLRLDVVDKLRQSELLVADRVGRGSLYSMVSHETNHLSVTFPLLVDSFQQTVLLVFSLIYLLYLSPAAFAVFLLAVGVGIMGYVAINRRFRVTLNILGQRQNRMLDAIDSVILGAKELRLHSARGAAVEKAYRRLSRACESLLVASGEHWAEMILLTSFVTYLMLGVVAFAFPHFITGQSLIVFQLVPVLLFCIGPLAKIVAQSPMFLRADVGLEGILHVQRQLAAAGSIAPAEARALAEAYTDFRTIAYDGITFTHQAETPEDSFTAGPLTLTLTRGELIFIVGGNGSGKSTAMKLMCGLYPAKQGVIRVDGDVVAGRAIAGLRELFSAIFVDFHLFDRLYGLENADPLTVNRLIDEMGLAGKVRFENGRFTRLHLSTGQRKRLALIAALLEDRPIYLFDEWSAEQDIHFRKTFYETILPSLRKKGKLVIAVTHDERYWHLADRVVKLDLGSIVWDRPGEHWSAP
ncbi:cyclic peptide export ABC transporter [Magnetospirillum sulfuroxidans]|uniref:Cyclic peptide export ABC transporter n=1 Tax=Magnetospirillum sulfuroxidans TaxID=611300 RepID=A0ABS5I7C4_9PROT|nr:cyclic peptide export ABC transporter [Magnetospirillum sulfuroxidans]MBR9970326.1 cyclic peptide export ABC transporter [Magnetospirillum sulfuroxidans]